MSAEQTKRPRTGPNVPAAANRSDRARRPVGGLFSRFRRTAESTQPDPVMLAIFAIDQVGPAAVRACASGVGVRLLVADEATAAVIRAALTQTARRRPTDRLIQVVSEQPDCLRAGRPDRGCPAT